MAYKVEAGNLSERVKGELEELSVIMASTVVAEKTWNAISATEVPAEGVFHEEWTTIKDLTTGEEFFTGSFPVVIPCGHEVQGNTTAENTGASTYRARCIAYLIDPDGNHRGEDIGPWRDFAPGDYYIKLTLPVVLDKPGSWQFYVVLETE